MRPNNNEPQINIEKPYELWDWAAELHVSAERLKKAVLTVGKSVRAVKLFLKK
ncbi:DUF3606 domain-containing protein [Pedobacter frigiditerrae]|uniref:DUF3606 domain-containing protein n=1 Tax=Pedobacter frigiditerrae TaxID=2530452 RepID=A0A4R0MPB4_9SPHI|nr:DUF3606 domain-containing protein [Pedobacter frigiditerrae]TCC88072.1 DUF3606 domain-containing protein [Pedobacter frigiditerrae]